MKTGPRQLIFVICEQLWQLRFVNNHKNQLQDLSCFRRWEFRSLGDLESLNDSKTPKLQAAKATSVEIMELWNCAIMPLWHYEIEGGQFHNGIMPQCHNFRMPQ